MLSLPTYCVCAYIYRTCLTNEVFKHGVFVRAVVKYPGAAGARDLIPQVPVPVVDTARTERLHQALADPGHHKDVQPLVPETNKRSQ